MFADSLSRESQTQWRPRETVWFIDRVKTGSIGRIQEIPCRCVAWNSGDDSEMQYSQLFHFFKDGLLFSYFEYHGTDYAADMARMAADQKTQEWWAIMMPMQRPLETRAKDEWWATMEEVFHLE